MLVVLDWFEVPDVDGHFIRVVKYRCTLWHRQAVDFKQICLDILQRRFAQWIRFVKNAGAINVAVALCIQTVTLSQKKLARARLRLRQLVTNRPRSLEQRISRISLRAKLETPRPAEIDLRVMI